MIILHIDEDGISNKNNEKYLYTYSDKINEYECLIIKCYNL